MKSGLTPSQPASWTFEFGHTETGFRARHMMVTRVHGLFKDVHGQLRMDLDDPLSASFSGEIDAAKVWTGEPDPDAHLRSADFFDVAELLGPATQAAPPRRALHD